jgi:ParB family transcriptional regulator, chromosome partitioning protein
MDGTIVEVNPFRCRMWGLHGRLDQYITDESCRSEIQSFENHGQLVPVLGRRVANDPMFDIELIYGARRLFVARHINKPLLVELRNVSDRDALIAMDIENRQRRDLSPYERGLSYLHWLNRSHFASQDDIACALKISASQVSRLIKLARLPTVVVNAFPDPSSICEGWGLDLYEAWQDPQRRKEVASRARRIGALSPRPPARAVYEHLLAAAQGVRARRTKTRDEVVKAPDGQPLFRIRHQHKTLALLLPSDRMRPKTLEAVRHALIELLNSPRIACVEDKEHHIVPHRHGPLIRRGDQKHRVDPCRERATA